MKILQKCLFVFICLSIDFSYVEAQGLSHFFVENAYQRSYFNPALNNEGFISVASGLSAFASNSGPALSDFLIHDESGGLVLSPQNAISSMEEVNDVFGNSEIHLLDVSLDVGLFRISAGHSWKIKGWLGYPRDLVDFAYNGNANHIGQTLNLGPGLNYLNYNEIYLGLQKKIGFLSLGGKIKFLSGVETIFTENHVLDLSTSDDIYQLSLTSDFVLKSAGAFEYSDISKFSFELQDFSLDHFLSGNSGIAFDIGGSLELGETAEISFSILDIGKIDWDTQISNLTSKKNLSFEGIDLSKYLSEDGVVSLSDSLLTLLEFEKNSEGFTTNLPIQVFLGATVDVGDSWTFGGLFHTIGTGDRRSTAFALNATRHFLKIVSLGASYVLRDDNIFNIGINGSLKIGPVVGFLSTDNIAGLVAPQKSKLSNIIAGLSVRF